MTTTLAQALVQVRARLDEADGLSASTNVAWLDSELRAWINEGCVDLTRRTHCLTDKTTTSTTGGTAEYTGPASAISVDIINYTPTGGTKTPVPYQHITNANSVQFISSGSYLPGWFSLRGMPPLLKICLYPTPSTNGSMEIFYTRTSATLATDGSADSSTLEVPEGWVDLVYDYCEARARRKDRDPSWQEAQQLYVDKIGFLLQIAGDYTHQTGQIFPETPYVPWYREF